MIVIYVVYARFLPGPVFERIHHRSYRSFPRLPELFHDLRLEFVQRRGHRIGLARHSLSGRASTTQL